MVLFFDPKHKGYCRPSRANGPVKPSNPTRLCKSTFSNILGYANQLFPICYYLISRKEQNMFWETEEDPSVHKHTRKTTS